MRKIIRSALCLCLAVVLILSIAAPAMALSSTMTYRTKDGTIKIDGRSYSYSTQLGACFTKAEASVSYEKSAVLSVRLSVTTTYLGRGYSDSSATVLNTTSLSVSQDNVFDVNGKDVQSSIYTASAIFSVAGVEVRLSL